MMDGKAGDASVEEGGDDANGVELDGALLPTYSQKVGRESQK